MTEDEYVQAVESYLDMVYRIALNWFRNPTDAEDAAQNTMLRLWQSSGTTDFEGEDHLRNWLVRVTLNECKRLSMHPWRKRTVGLEICAEMPHFDRPQKGELYESVMALPGKYRVPVYLYYYEGYSVGEIARMMELKESTVQTRLARARAKLKSLLTED